MNMQSEPRLDAVSDPAFDMEFNLPSFEDTPFAPQSELTDHDPGAAVTPHDNNNRDAHNTTRARC
ncbi:hypothetical protein NX059_003721 [Plenodomus lindquistii]|nr:hypothetical protein NX059_003721 [Plenodomus lindquistii]